MTEVPEKVVVNNLFKIFGNDPHAALELYRNGLNKEEIFDRTGQTIGVCDATFGVRTGEVFVVMGLSGSGKSTLVRLLNRLIDPTFGSIEIDGHDIAKMSDEEILELRRRSVSMVFQSFALMPHMTVLQNASFGLELGGIDKRRRDERAKAALEQVGLLAWAHAYPQELSGGMQQRVGLARALANDPSVMLMDEAFSALDPLIRSEMQDELLKLQEENQRTVIFISHDLDEAMRIGDRIAIMEGGRVVQVDTPEDILKNPADDYVRSFFRGVDVSNVITAGEVARDEQVTVIEREGMGVRAALQRMKKFDRPFAYVVDRRRHYHGVVSTASLEAQLRKDDSALQGAYLADIEPVHRDTLIHELLGRVAEAPCGVPVVDDEKRYLGVISRAALLETLNRDGEK